MNNAFTAVPLDFFAHSKGARPFPNTETDAEAPDSGYGQPAIAARKARC